VSDFEKFSKLFNYEEETGKLFWKIGKNTGYEAGGLNKGYKETRVFGKLYKVHRIIWLLKTGTWPVNQIDHIDRVRDNNRFSNLRDVTNRENANNVSAHIDSTTGVVGVYLSANGKWYVQRRKKCLGTFVLLKDAIAAYDAAE